MKVIICGKEERLESVVTVADLLRHMKIGEHEKGFAVAVNEEIVFRSTWNNLRLSEGDRIEIVRATQGG